MPRNLISQKGNRTALRLCFAYGAIFVAIGAALPYLPVWLEGRGFSAHEIGLATAAAMVARFAAALVLGPLADLIGRKRVLVGAAGALLIAYGLHAPAAGVLLIAVVVALAGAAIGVIPPILDAVSMRASLREGFSYGRVRSVGSAAFIVANIVVGVMMTRWGSEAALAGMIAGSAGFLAASLALPRFGAPDAPDDAAEPESDLRTPIAALIFAFAASALIQGGHAFYYGFSALAWRDQGFSEVQIGLLWGWGVLAEIIFFASFGRRAATIPISALFAVGALSGVARWTALAFAPGLAASFLVQTLHAGTYAATHLALVTFIARHVPERAAATAQSVNSALTMGGALAVASAASGYLYESVGAWGYLAMAGVCAGGLAASAALALVLRVRRLARRGEDRSRRLGEA